MEKNQMNLYTETSPFDDLFPSTLQPHLTALIMAGAYELYGNPLPDTVKDRVIREIGAIRKNGNQHRFLTARRIAQKMREACFYLRGWGTGDVSLAAFLCGISEINPLPPHYRCPHCRHSDFDVPRNVLSGYDLPPKMCPICGTQMCTDGQDIPAACSFGADDNRVVHFAWACSEEGIAWLRGQIELLPAVSGLFQSFDGCLISDLLEIQPDAREAALQEFYAKDIIRSVSLDEAVREILHSGRCSTDSVCVESIFGKLPAEAAATTFGEIIWNMAVSHLKPEGQKALRDLRERGKMISELPFCREDVLLQLTGYGIDQGVALRIIDTVRCTRAKRIPPEVIRLLQNAGVPDWYLNTLPFLQNLWRKAHSVSSLQIVLKILYYYLHDQNVAAV